jgi:hypothetical protein
MAASTLVILVIFALLVLLLLLELSTPNRRSRS